MCLNTVARSIANSKPAMIYLFSYPLSCRISSLRWCLVYDTLRFLLFIFSATILSTLSHQTRQIRTFQLLLNEQVFWLLPEDSWRRDGYGHFIAADGARHVSIRGAALFCRIWGGLASGACTALLQNMDLGAALRLLHRVLHCRCWSWLYWRGYYWCGWLLAHVVLFLPHWLLLLLSGNFAKVIIEAVLKLVLLGSNTFLHGAWWLKVPCRSVHHISWSCQCWSCCRLFLEGRCMKLVCRGKSFKADILGCQSGILTSLWLVAFSGM